jgi:chromate transporter
MLLEVAKLFLKLGLTAFGGPAAHIAMFHDEVVRRRKWLDDAQFLDLLGATNLIPGPNSTEMAIHLGYLRAGWAGLAAAGVCFILPSMLIVLGISWAYVRFGSMPQAAWLLYGIKPVVIAIIVQALWNLGVKAVKGPLTAAAGLTALALDLAGVNPLLALVIAGLLVMLGANLGRLARPAASGAWIPLGAASLLPKAVSLLEAKPFSIGVLFLTFLKIGSVLYGSGYVLLAFLRAEFVNNLGWLTDQQLLDAIALGQVTPGPVFTSATFVGYLVGGIPGGLAATLGIFLPSFVFVAVSNPFIPRLRRSPWAAGLLDGVNAASLGLMAAVTWQLSLSSLVDPLTLALALLSLILLFRYKVNTTWLILLGGLAGLAKFTWF